MSQEYAATIYHSIVNSSSRNASKLDFLMKQFPWLNCNGFFLWYTFSLLIAGSSAFSSKVLTRSSIDSSRVRMLVLNWSSLKYKFPLSIIYLRQQIACSCLDDFPDENRRWLPGVIFSLRMAETHKLVFWVRINHFDWKELTFYSE